MFGWNAPVGYMAEAFKICATITDMDFDKYFNKDSQTELYIILSVKISYIFIHCLASLLEGAGYRTPTAVNAHGFLTVNGEKKMSKSRGTFIKAETLFDAFRS